MDWYIERANKEWEIFENAKFYYRSGARTAEIVEYLDQEYKHVVKISKQNIIYLRDMHAVFLMV